MNENNIAYDTPIGTKIKEFIQYQEIELAFALAASVQFDIQTILGGYKQLLGKHPHEILSEKELTSLFEAKVLRIDFFKNPHVAIVPEIAHLQQLEKLHLYGGDDAPVVPDYVFRLYQLRELSIHNFNVPYLPDTIGNMRFLHTFEIDACGLRALPPSFWKLPQLTSLGLIGNSLYRLPPTIHQLKKLVFLDVSHNPISSLPFELSLLNRLNAVTIHKTAVTKRELHRLKGLFHEEVGFFHSWSWRIWFRTWLRMTR